MAKTDNFSIRYRILDAKRGVPQRACRVLASHHEIAELVVEGFMIRRKLVSDRKVRALRNAVSEVLRREKTRRSRTKNTCFESDYLRNLLDKHAAFAALFRLRATASIARAVLGPQIRFDEITARITELARSPASTPWHIHLRVVPEPLPPFFAYPHGIECLLYLDDADEANGALCVLPGSHREVSRIHSYQDVESKPGQKGFSLSAGDCVIMHTNLWHRVLPSATTQGRRRVVIFGYQPSWISGEERGGSLRGSRVLKAFRKHRASAIRELAGEFYWG